MHSVLGAAIMLVIAVGAYGAGAVAQAVGARQAEAHPDGSRGLFAILSHPASLLGLVFDLVAWVLSRLALHTLPLFTVNTVLAGSLAVTVLLSHRFLETALHRRELWAIGATVLGLVLVGLAADSSVAIEPTDTMRRLIIIFLPILACGGLLAVKEKLPPPVIGGCSGLAFGASALAARSITTADGILSLFREPLLWVMLGYAGVGVMLFTRGLERGSVGSVTAAMWAAEIVPASIIGFVWLGDTVRPGWGVAAFAGIGLTLFATAVLAVPADAAAMHAPH